MKPSKSTRIFGSSSVTLALGVVLGAPRGFAEEFTPANKAQSLAEALRQSQEQVRQLAASLHEVQAEAARSRAEVTELRQELQAARAELAAVAGSVADSRSSEPDSTVAAAGGTQSTDAGVSKRVVKLEEEQQLLAAKVDDQYQKKVESASKYRVPQCGERSRQPAYATRFSWSLGHSRLPRHEPCTGNPGTHGPQ